MEKLKSYSIDFFVDNDLSSLKISVSDKLLIEITEPNMPETIISSMNLNRTDTLKLIDFLNFAIKNK